MTNDFLKDGSIYNQYIKGGAKYTTNYNTYWEPICIVDGLKIKVKQCNVNGN